MALPSAGGAIEGDGLRCRFGEGMPLVMGILERNGAYNGTDDALAAKTRRASSATAPRCRREHRRAQTASARVQVTNNGDAAALGPSEVFFTFFEAAGGAYYEAVRPKGQRPRAGTRRRLRRLCKVS